MHSNMSCGLIWVWKMKVLMMDDNCKAIFFYFRTFFYTLKLRVYNLLFWASTTKMGNMLVTVLMATCPFTFTCRENVSKILEHISTLLLVNCCFMEIAVNCLLFSFPKRVLNFSKWYFYITILPPFIFPWSFII